MYNILKPIKILVVLVFIYFLANNSIQSQIVRSGISISFGSLFGIATIEENTIILNNQECSVENNTQARGFPSFSFQSGLSNNIQYKFFHTNFGFNINLYGIRYVLKYPNREGVLENIDERISIFNIGFPLTFGHTFLNNKSIRLFGEAGASINIPFTIVEYDNADNDVYISDDYLMEDILYTRNINYNIILGAGISLGYTQLTLQYDWYPNSFSKYQTSVGNLSLCCKIYVKSLVVNKRKVYPYDSKKK